MKTNQPKPNRRSLLDVPCPPAAVLLRKTGWMFDAVLTFVLLLSSAGPALATANPTPMAANTTVNHSADRASAIPRDQLGAVAGKQYQGDGLSVSARPEGARLRCVFQRLEGEATRTGLWLTSTVPNAANDRFRVVAAAVGRQRIEPSTLNPQLSTLPRTGHVAVEGQLVRFARPGLVEEYSVSLDGVRQDFVIAEKPDGPGELRLELAVSGARVEPAACGTQLVLEHSGRKIAYSRLRVTDATGKELTARIVVGRRTPCAPRPVTLGNDSEPSGGAQRSARPTF